ncbi:MAG: ferrous iron transport protein A [Verrucomicrobiota bacterium]|nr:ferrous iron transport protein A [Verrucomicrobiota bacterium]
MTLAESKEGDFLKIIKIGGEGAIKQRLLDMGITRGEKIKVNRYAPLKDPIQITVKGYSLALRVSEGQDINVEKL